MPYADGLLATNERILRRERQHWMFPLLIAGRWVAIAFVIGVIGFLMTQLTGGDGISGFVDALLTWGTVIALGIALVGLIWSTIQWQAQEYVLTDRRVMHIRGVINKQSTDASLENITDAQITIPWLGRIMGFGDLIFLTAAETGLLHLRTLKDPIEFKKDLLDAKNERLIEINQQRMPTPPVRAEAPAPPADQAAPMAASAAAAAPAATGPQATTPAASPSPTPAAAPSPTAASSADVTKTLASLADLRDSGAITPEEYEAKKTELLGRI